MHISNEHSAFLLLVLKQNLQPQGLLRNEEMMLLSFEFALIFLRFLILVLVGGIVYVPVELDFNIIKQVYRFCNFHIFLLVFVFICQYWCNCCTRRCGWIISEKELMLVRYFDLALLHISYIKTPFCLCTQGPIFIRPEETFAHLYYLV